jgi:hypothetical protein
VSHVILHSARPVDNLTPVPSVWRVTLSSMEVSVSYAMWLTVSTVLITQFVVHVLKDMLSRELNVRYHVISVDAQDVM